MNNNNDNDNANGKDNQNNENNAATPMTFLWNLVFSDCQYILDTFPPRIVSLSQSTHNVY